MVVMMRKVNLGCYLLVWNGYFGDHLLLTLGCTVVVQDLKNAKSIVDWIAWAEPQYDFNPMIDEWCKEAPKELDFNHEAGMLFPVWLSYQDILVVLIVPCWSACKYVIVLESENIWICLWCEWFWLWPCFVKFADQPKNLKLAISVYAVL